MKGALEKFINKRLFQIIPFRILLTFLTLLVCNNPLCAQYEQVFKIPFPEQMRLLDSIFIKAAKIDSATLYSEFVKAKTAAVNTNDYTQLNLDRAILSVKTDYGYELPAADSNGQKIIQRAEVLNAPEIAGVEYMTLGYFYELKQQDFGKAFENYLKGYDIFDKLAVNKLPPKQYGQYKVGLAYYYYGDFENALKLSLRTNKSFLEKTNVYVFNTVLIGMCYMKLGYYDSARIHFNLVFNHANLMASEPAWQGIALGNTGISYFLQHQVEKAVEYLSKAIPLTIEGKVADNTARFASRLSTIFLEQGKLAESKKYLNIALESANQAKETEEYYNAYNSATAYYRAVNNSQLALAYGDSAKHFSVEMAARKNLNTKYQIEMARQNELVKEREKLFAKEKQNQLILRNAIIASVLLLMVISLLLYNRSLLKNKARHQKLMAEKLLAETELRAATNQLDKFTRSITEKNELIEKAAAEIERVNMELNQVKSQRPDTRITTEVPNPLRLLQQTVLLTDDAWIEFTQLFEKVHGGFFFQLKEKFPGLSPAETRFIALARLKLSNKEMAGMLGVGTDAIRQIRSRLKKKLSLKDEEAIEEVAGRI